MIVTPNQNFVRVTNNATTGEPDTITTIGIIRGLSDNNVRVWEDSRRRSSLFGVHFRSTTRQCGPQHFSSRR